MSRSTYINAFIRDLFSHDQIKTVIVSDGQESFICSTAKTAFEVIDSVNEVEIEIFGLKLQNAYERTTTNRLGWFQLIMCNDDEEQLSDYTANELCDTIVQNIDPMAAYNAILEEPETEDYNNIDKARDLLEQLLDDNKQLIGDDAGSIIQKSIDLLR